MIDLAVLRQIINDNGLIIQVKNDNYDETECLMNIADDLELLLKPKNNGWISVDDELPKHKETYLTIADGQFGIAKFYPEDKGWIFKNFEVYELLANVTHWQPLPQPPKE